MAEEVAAESSSGTEACERCGRVDSLVGCGGRTFCEDCYYLYGSCCADLGSPLET